MNEKDQVKELLDCLKSEVVDELTKGNTTDVAISNIAFVIGLYKHDVEGIFKKHTCAWCNKEITYNERQSNQTCDPSCNTCAKELLK